MPQHENQEPEPLGDDQLDRLLLRAEWPMPSADSAQRLGRRWDQLCGESSRSNWRSILAVAACLGVVMGGAWIFRNSARQADRAKVTSTVTIPLARAEAGELGRPATNIELAMLRVVSAQMRAYGSAVVVAPAGVPLVPAITGWSVRSATKAAMPALPPPVDANDTVRRAMGAKDPRQRDRLLDDLAALGPGSAGAAVLRMLAEPDASPPIVAALVRHPQGWSDLLFSALNDSHILVRSAAAQALAQIDGPVITARLISMANADINRREAVTALVRIHSTDARQYVEAAKQSSELGAIIRSAIAQNVGVAVQTGDY